MHPQLGEVFQHAFTTFRAAKMKEEWLHKWTQAVGGKRMPLPMHTSTSLSPVAAIEKFGLLKKGDDKELSTYLFIFTIACKTPGCYFHLDSELYSAYPEEREVLLQEGGVV